MSHLWLDSFRGVVGKRIHGVLVAEHPSTPRNQVFLVFDDGTYYELFGDTISGIKGIDPEGMDQVRSYAQKWKEVEITLDVAES
jgi:hypothetical protein